MTRRKGSHHKRSRAVASPATDAGATEDDSRAFWTGWLLAIITVGVLVRLFYLRQPMRYDESVTWVHFAARSWAAVIGSYTYPNNHVFHTVLVKACATLLGDEPWVIRLPAFAAGVAMIPLTYAVALRLYGSVAAHIAAALVAGSGALVLYSTNARGYTIIGAATLVLIATSLRLRQRSSIRLWAVSVLVVALGTWTIPVMLFPAGGVALWFTLSALRGDTSEPRADLRRIGLAIAAAAALVAVFYLPILDRNGIAALTGNAFVRSSRWSVFFLQLPSSVPQVIASWTLGVPTLIAGMFGICAIVGLFYERRHSGMRVSLSGSMYVWCALVLLITHRAPFPRVWLFLFAPVAALAALGLVELVSHVLSRVRVLSESVKATASGPAGVVVSLALAGTLVLSDGVLTSRDTGTLRDAEQIAQSFALRLRAGDRVIAPLPSNGPLAYYFLRSRVDTAYLSAAPGEGSTVYLIVNTDEGFTLATRLIEPLMQRFTRGELLAKYPSAEIYRLY